MPVCTERTFGTGKLVDTTIRLHNLREIFLYLSDDEKSGTQTCLTDGTSVNITYNCPSEQQIADISGTTREEVSEVISYFQRKGFIALSDKELYVFQKPVL